MLLLNSCRSGKVRGTTCDEIGTEVIGGLPSAEFQVWAIVAKRMKAGREHVAPLNTAGFTVIATARVRQHNTLLL
ncbi:hypothetical protein GCM10009096_23580 [Parasphingorhabdus litoris]|uniref:CHAT domain-containing protein n=2 Tax=Parasphingorhabdus litoris TaxID=394733 RepID=A0ABN1ANL3_9SPHN